MDSYWKEIALDITEGITVSATRLDVKYPDTQTLEALLKSLKQLAVVNELHKEIISMTENILSKIKEASPEIESIKSETSLLVDILKREII